MMRIILCLAIYATISSCKPKPNIGPIPYQKIQGKTMGTYYNITMNTAIDAALVQIAIDSILNDFENELSTYRPSSSISRFNQSPEGICLSSSSYFYQAIQKARELYKLTDGNFDPTIAPLVNFYGFG